MLGAIPSWGVSAGIDKDKIGGIEKQYDHIKKEITPIIEELLTKKEGKYPDITATLKTLFNLLMTSKKSFSFCTIKLNSSPRKNTFSKTWE